MRFASDSFAPSYKQTIGVDFFIKQITLPGDIRVALQLWDIGGQSIGGKMINNYIYGAHAIVLCYDITNQDSFQDLEDWYRLVTKSFSILPKSATSSKHADDSGDGVTERGQGSDPSIEQKTSPSTSSGAGRPLVVLMSNKSDLEHLRAVRVKQSRIFADENSFMQAAVSAKSGDGVNLAFHQIAAALAGVSLPKAEVESHTAVITAQITQHMQHDVAVAKGEVPDYTKSKSSCAIS
jgi:Ras-related protein Rab-28